MTDMTLDILTEAVTVKRSATCRGRWGQGVLTHFRGHGIARLRNGVC